MSGKYSQKLLNPAEKSAADVLKTASKRAVQKLGAASGDFLIIKSLATLQGLI